MTSFTLKQFRVPHACIVTAVSFVSSIYIDAYSSPIQDTLITEGVVSRSIYPIFASNTFFGALIGSLIAGPLSEWLGIKSVFILFCPLSIIGSFLLILAINPVSMVLGRGLIGVYCGTCLACSPVYNAEICPPHLRQVYGSIYNIAIGIGFTLCYLLGIWFGYRWLAFVYLLMTTFMVVNLLFLPESPKWLANKGLYKSARKAREYFYTSNETIPLNSVAINHITSYNSFVYKPSLRRQISTYLTWPVIRPLLVCSSVQLFKCSSGYTFLLAYSSHTLETGGKLDPNVVSLFSPLFLLAGSIVFIFVIRRVNWKWLLLITTISQIICNALLGVSLHLYTTSYNSPDYPAIHITLQYAPIVLTSCFEFSMALGWGSISWYLYGELLHSHFTRVSAGIVTFVCYTTACLNQLIGPMIVSVYGTHSVFYGYSIMCLVGLGFQYFY